MGFTLQSHVYIEGRDADAVRVLVMSLVRARCSPARPNYSFMVIELSREGGGMHPNHSVGSQTNMGFWVEQITPRSSESPVCF